MEAVGVAFEREDLGVVNEAVDHRRGGHFVAEDLPPGRERLVRGDDPPKRVECEPLDAVRRGGRSLLSYSCTAVTSDVPVTDASEGGIIGYPYRALADPRDGSFSFCRVAGQPGEGSYTREALVRLPRACG